jgi:NADH-quinone oxidoreductase subunit A
MSPYVPVVILCVLSAIVVGAMVSLNTLLGPRASNAVKSEPFECGNAATGPAFRRFSVRFYMTAILFILFDVEVVFFYPWAVLFPFMLVLGVGLLYAWRKGALEWD